MKNRSPHYPDPANGRTRLYAFNWIGGGFNQVYARSERDAIKLANEHFGGGTANLRVDEPSVRLVRDPRAYYDNMPSID